MKTSGVSDRARGFHTLLPGYAPTRLINAASIAEEMGLERVWIKYEGGRFGLPSFKILGASWATCCAINRRGDRAAETIDQLRMSTRELGISTLAAATDGNHGQAVARMAAWLELQAKIFVPLGTTAARIDAIRSEGATVEVVDGTYDETVERCAAHADDVTLVISDTPCSLGGTDTASWAIEGYETIMYEVEQDLSEQAELTPDTVVVQVGTGGLAASIVRHVLAGGKRRPTIVVVEPTHAACAFAAFSAGQIVTLPVGPDASIMAGLNAGTVSSAAWPWLKRGVDVFVTIDDTRAAEGVRAFASAGIAAGESGAAGLAGLLELAANRDGRSSGWTLDDARRVLLVCTEAPTDPDSYRRLVSEGAVV